MASAPQLKADAEVERVGARRVGVSARSADELLHEIQVRQIELEMQNERLREAQAALKESRDRYANLYEFAPVGYLTLSDSGAIGDINLTGATLLGEDRAHLTQRRFSDFVAPDNRDKWLQHVRYALQHEGAQTCELSLLRRDGTVFDAFLDCLLTTTGEGVVQLRMTLTDITARKLADEMLRKLSVAVEQSPASVVITNQDALIQYVNPRFTEVTGYSADEAIGQTPRILGSGKMGKEIYSDMWGKLTSGLPWNGELLNQRKNGELYWEESHIAPVKNPAGEITHYVAVKIDVTKRKRAEEALRESETRNQALISAIPDIIFTYRCDGEYLTVHASDPSMLFAPPETLLHRKIEQVMPKPIADLFMKAIADAMESNAMQEVRYSLPVDNDQERHFEARVVPCTEDTVISIVRDITERERERRSRELRAAQLSVRLEVSEADLLESEQRLSLAADAASLGIWIRDPVRDDFWASDHWRTLFGFSRTQRLDAAKVLQRVYPEDRPTVSRALGFGRQDKGGHESVFRIELPGRQLRWISSHGRVELDAEGNPVRIRGVSLDITARKQAELEVEQKRKEVTHLSRVAMLGELSGALAHELNQPLMAILSNAQAAQRFLEQDSVDFNELRDILRDIVDEDKRAGEVIRRLRLLFAKGETTLQSVNINELVAEGLGILRNDIINHGVTLQTELALEAPTVRADRVQLQQVVINLVMNACDAMEAVVAQDRQIVVRTAIVDATVRVSVIDQGAGIPAGGREKIFEPFYTTKERGMGLGLSICRNIVTASGGRLWAENNAGRGASFHFSVPLQSKTGRAA
jgi:PAS domain S-box-containing protein